MGFPDFLLGAAIAMNVLDSHDPSALNMRRTLGPVEHLARGAAAAGFRPQVFGRYRQPRRNDYLVLLRERTAASIVFLKRSNCFSCISFNSCSSVFPSPENSDPIIRKRMDFKICSIFHN